jgi:hypothetical protein
MHPSFVVRVLGLTLLSVVVGCGSAKNTPEQAFADLRTALKEQRWDVLYDLLPPAKQTMFDQQVAAFDANLTAVRAELGAKELDAKLMKDIGVTFDGWKKLDKKQRLAKLWAGSANDQLVELGINPGEIENSTVKETRIIGDKAEISLDDGKGHRSRLTFVLVEGYWRFDLDEGGGARER